MVFRGRTHVVRRWTCLAWVGYSILDVLATDTLVSLPQVKVSWAYSALPIGAVLFVIGQALVFPEILRKARSEAHPA